MASASESETIRAIRTVAACYGYENLKEEQESALEEFVSGKDVFVSLPTGSGKSLCYGLLPSVFDTLRNVEKTSIAIVVSPLISLMKDQTAAFNQLGISSVCVSDKEETSKELKQKILRGQHQLVFMSPESLFCNLLWRRMLSTSIYSKNLIAFVIDEAHCVKKW